MTCAPQATPSCLVPVVLMDNHKDALAFWRTLEITGATCLHVDAHLDVSNLRARAATDSEEIGVDCGNFLFTALREGVITHLVWVIPPQLAASSPTLLDWVRGELRNWMRLSAQEERSLHARGDCVEGTLVGARLTVCTADTLPEMEPTSPLLVDLDVDYCLDTDDSIWQHPIALYDRIACLGPTAVTITTSVEGGHTPPQHRYLGNLGVLCFTGRRDEALDLWNRLQAGGHPGEGDPSWFQAACLALEACRTGQGYHDPAWVQAAALDPAYRLRPLDLASLYFRREDYGRCEEWLGRVQEINDLPGALYHQGLVACRRRDFASADGAWQELLRQPVAQGGTAAHLHEMRGHTLMSLGQHEEAVAAFQASLHLVPGNAAAWRELARAQQEAGRADDAARSRRRAVTLAPGDQATPDVLHALASWYADTGQVMLAEAARRGLEQQGGESLPCPSEPGGAPSQATGIPPAAQELIDLCNAVRKGATERVPELRARLANACHALEEAREGSTHDAAVPASGGELIRHAVERGFAAYAVAFDHLQAALAGLPASPSPVPAPSQALLWRATSELATAARQLACAQSAHEAIVLTTGPSRFPTVNLFANLAQRWMAGQLPQEQWRDACRSHYPFFSQICARFAPRRPEEREGHAPTRILDVLRQMEALEGACTPAELGTMLQSLLEAHQELEVAAAAHEARQRSAPPTASPLANQLLLAARGEPADESRGAALVRDLREQVHEALTRVHRAARASAEAEVPLVQVPRLLAALEALDDSLGRLGAGVAGADVLQSMVQELSTVHACHQALQQSPPHADLAAGLFTAPPPHPGEEKESLPHVH